VSPARTTLDKPFIEIEDVNIHLHVFARTADRVSSVASIRLWTFRRPV